MTVRDADSHWMCGSIMTQCMNVRSFLHFSEKTPSKIQPVHLVKFFIKSYYLLLRGFLFHWTNISSLQIHGLMATHDTYCCKLQQVFKNACVEDELQSHPLGCSVTPELMYFFELFLFFYISLPFLSFSYAPPVFFFSHFLSNHTTCCLCSFFLLFHSILPEINIFLFYFSAQHLPISIPLSAIYLLCFMKLSTTHVSSSHVFLFDLFLPSYASFFSSPFFLPISITGAGRLPTPRREC